MLVKSLPHRLLSRSCFSPDAHATRAAHIGTSASTAKIAFVDVARSNGVATTIGSKRSVLDAGQSNFQNVDAALNKLRAKQIDIAILTHSVFYHVTDFLTLFDEWKVKKAVMDGTSRASRASPWDRLHSPGPGRRGRGGRGHRDGDRVLRQPTRKAVAPADSALHAPAAIARATSVRAAAFRRGLRPSRWAKRTPLTPENRVRRELSSLSRRSGIRG